MTSLVIIEHDNNSIHSNAKTTISAAKKLNSEIWAIIIGFDCNTVIEEVKKFSDIEKIFYIDNELHKNHFAELYADQVNQFLLQNPNIKNVLMTTSSLGKETIPRIAALQDVSQVSDISAVVSEDTFERPIYAGNCIATVQSTDPVKVVTVRITGFDACDATGGSATITSVDNDTNAGVSSFVKEEIAESDRPELTAAEVVISGGRGMQNGDNFSLLNGIADKLGAAIGASRAAVDSGFVPNDMQVGQTGKIVAPDLYIAVGISGAIQHLAGMKDSKVIVAINKDEDAPIFQVADYGLVADLFEALPELESKL